MFIDFKRLFILGALLGAAPGCEAADEDDYDSILGQAQAALGSLRVPLGKDDRGYLGDEDWSEQHWKGECALNEFVSGLSRVRSGQPNVGALHGVLCSRVSANATPVEPTLDISAGDHRRYDGTGDWHYGYHKAECGANEVVSGISQSSDYKGRIKNVRCVSPGSTRFVTGCHRVSIDDTYIPNDLWDPGYALNKCQDTEVLRGVSADPKSGQLRALLCCPVPTIVP